jgi:hypothetical protein
MGEAPGLDTAVVAVHNAAAVRTVVTDGGGFFGAVDLEPGTYEVRASGNGVVYAGRVRVEAGRVATVDLRVFPLNLSGNRL